jgi:hypothetical protein
MNIINQLNAPPETTALQKVLILIGFGTFLTLAALTASLPLPLLHNQPNSLPTTNDQGSTAWMIVAAFFGIMLAPAVSYLYGNIIYLNPLSFLISFSSQFVRSLYQFLC